MAGGGTLEEELPGVEEAARMLARFSANNHTICDAELRSIGVPFPARLHPSNSELRLLVCPSQPTPSSPSSPVMALPSCKGH